MPAKKASKSRKPRKMTAGKKLSKVKPLSVASTTSPTESVSFNFTKIQTTYSPQK